MTMFELLQDYFVDREVWDCTISAPLSLEDEAYIEVHILYGTPPTLVKKTVKLDIIKHVVCSE